MLAAKVPNCITWRVSILERHRKDERYRQHLQSQDVTEKERKNVGPTRKHVATATEHEHWSIAYYLKQTTAGGADTVATTEYVDLQKAEDCHREHVCAQRETNTPTQPHNSNPQWQDWNKWRTEVPSTHAEEPGDNAMRLWETEGVMLHECLTI